MFEPIKQLVIKQLIEEISTLSATNMGTNKNLYQNGHGFFIEA